MAKFKNLILTELGETTETYRLRNVSMGLVPGGGTILNPPEVDAAWEFSTENYNYKIHISNNDYPEFLTVDFTTDETGTEATNEGNPFKVTATVIEAAKRTFERLKDREEYDLIRGFRFKGVPKQGSDRDETQRNKLYITFIKNQFPSADIEKMSYGGVKVTV